MAAQASSPDSVQKPLDDLLKEATSLLGDCNEGVKDLWRIAGELRKIVKKS